jgi:hypothetical protein
MIDPVSFGSGEASRTFTFTSDQLRSNGRESDPVDVDQDTPDDPGENLGLAIVAQVEGFVRDVGEAEPGSALANFINASESYMQQLAAERDELEGRYKALMARIDELKKATIDLNEELRVVYDKVKRTFEEADRMEAAAPDVMHRIDQKQAEINRLTQLLQGQGGSSWGTEDWLERYLIQYGITLVSLSRMSVEGQLQIGLALLGSLTTEKEKMVLDESLRPTRLRCDAQEYSDNMEREIERKRQDLAKQMEVAIQEAKLLEQEIITKYQQRFSPEGG